MMDNRTRNLKTLRATELGSGIDIYLLEVPVTIKNFTEKMNAPESSLLSSLAVPSSTVAGIDGGDSSWVVKTRLNVMEKEASFYLHFCGDPWSELEAERCLSVRDESAKTLWVFKGYTDDDGKRFVPERDTFLCSISLTDAMAKNWLINGALHVCAEIRFRIGYIPRPRLRNPSGALLQYLRCEVGNPALSDFTLHSRDGEQIKCHKLLLGMVSPVFRAMFLTDCTETRTGVCKVEDADAETIKKLLECLVGFDVTDADGNSISVEEQSYYYYEMDFKLLEKVFQLADKYQILPVKDMCERGLEAGMSMENVAEICYLAEKHSAANLKIQAFVFIEDNMVEAVEKDVILKLIDLGREANLDLHDGLKAHSCLRRSGASGELGEPWRPHHADSDDEA